MEGDSAIIQQPTLAAPQSSGRYRPACSSSSTSKLTSQPKPLHAQDANVKKIPKHRAASIPHKRRHPPPPPSPLISSCSHPRRRVINTSSPLRSPSCRSSSHATFRPHSSNITTHLGCPAAHRFPLQTIIDHIAQHGAHSQRDRLSRPRRR